MLVKDGTSIFHDASQLVASGISRVKCLAGPEYRGRLGSERVQDWIEIDCSSGPESMCMQSLIDGATCRFYVLWTN
ncbi:unnamed protein product [Calypogeia fissa]